MTSKLSVGLDDIRTFVVPSAMLDETLLFLRGVGDKGYEAFVLWGGRREGTDVFRFMSANFPEQRASRTERGLMVVVDGEALFAVNKRLFESGQTLGGQVHTHPGSAYHSDLDDQYPLATLVGSLSVVIPDFARFAPNDLRNWAWYRLREYGVWAPLDQHTEVVFE